MAKVQQEEQIKAFNWSGYHFDEDRSSDAEYVFFEQQFQGSDGMMKHILPIILIMVFALIGCSSVKQEQNAAAYKQISQEEAKEMMGRDDGHVIVDVRRQDEYDAGHIPGAILIPNESIGCDSPEALPDYDQIILVYCRSGNRSRQAAEKLAAMGYTNIYEFGGINTWTGETVTEEEEK